jgi:hypothetical protein
MDPQSIAKSDVFFVVTTVAVILITIVVVIGCAYIIGILRTVKRISRMAERTTQDVSEDINELRDDVKRHGVSLGAFLNFFHRLGKKHSARKK